MKLNVCFISWDAVHLTPMSSKHICRFVLYGIKNSLDEYNMYKL